MFSIQSYLTLRNPMNCSSWGFSAHWLLQARILEWIAIFIPGDLLDLGIEPMPPALQTDSIPSDPPGKPNVTFSSVLFSRSVMSDSLRPHESQHARPPRPSPTTRVHSDSRPSSRWCHPAISSSVVSFSCPQSLPASESFPMSQLFTWGGQSTGASALVSFVPKNTQGWSPSEWTGWISLQSKGLSRVFSNTTVQKHQFFGTQLSSQSNSHIHTWPLEKGPSLTRRTFVGKVMSLLFNMLSRLDITFLSRSKRLLISWLQSLSAVILEPKTIKSDTVSTVSPSISHGVMGPDAMIFVFWVLSFKPTFSLSSFTFIKRLFSSYSIFAIRVVSSAYLRLLIFLLEILIPACASSSPAFLMMYSAYKLNKQGDSIQSVVPCPVLTVASWPAYRFSQEAGYESHSFNLQRMEVKLTHFMTYLALVRVSAYPYVN